MADVALSGGWTGYGLASASLTVVDAPFTLWPFEPNMAGGIRERYGYATNVLRARDGTEQRIGLRSIAVGGLGFRHMLSDQEIQHAQALLYDRQPEAWGVPLWMLANRSTASAAAGQAVVMVDTTSIPWAVGMSVMLWTDAMTYELAEVSAIAADRLTLAANLANTWAAGTIVAPVVVGRLPKAQAISWEALRMGTPEVAFEVEGFFA